MSEQVFLVRDGCSVYALDGDAHCYTHGTNWRMSDGPPTSCAPAIPASDPPSAEQEVRDMLERIGVAGAQLYTAGDLVELANLVADYHRTQRALDEALERERGSVIGFHEIERACDTALRLDVPIGDLVGRIRATIRRLERA